MFSVGEARRRAGVASGPAAFDGRSGRWVLVDPVRRRTFLVPADPAGEVPSLPGDARYLVETQGDGGSVSVWHIAASEAEGERFLERARAGGLESEFSVSERGYENRSFVILTVAPADLSALARLLDEAGARLEGGEIKRAAAPGP